MKTGRLLKFPRPGADVQAYLYREGDTYRAAVYVLSPPHGQDEPVHTISGADEASVEAALRAWVERQFPRPS